MKRKTLLLIAALVALPGVTYADSPFSSLQSAHEKNTILKDLRKMCTPKGALTDEAWEKKIMASEGNQQHIREANIGFTPSCMPNRIWPTFAIANLRVSVS